MANSPPEKIIVQAASHHRLLDCFGNICDAKDVSKRDYQLMLEGRVVIYFEKRTGNIGCCSIFLETSVGKVLGVSMSRLLTAFTN